MSERSSQLIDTILQELSRARKRIASARVFLGLILVISFGLGVWTILAAIESSAWMSSLARQGIVVAFLTIVVIAIVALVLYPTCQLLGILKGPSDEDLARKIGRKFTLVSDKVLSVLSLSRGQHSSTDPDMLDGAIQSLANDIDTSVFSSVEDFATVKRFGRYGAGCLALVALPFILAPTSFFGASQRLLSPATHFSRPVPFSFSMTPGSVSVVRGSSLEIEASLEGNQTPDFVEFEVINEGEKVSRRVETTRTYAAFTHTFANVRQDFRYRAVGGGYSSDWYDVNVFERPVVQQLNIELTPPSYARSPRISLDPNVGDVSGLRGTTVQVRANIAGPALSTAVLAFNDGTEQQFDIEGSGIETAFTIRKSGTYHISILSADEIENADPIEYRIDARIDESPSILMLSPDSSTPLNEANNVNFTGRIIDDYGFKRLALNYKVVASRFGETSEDFTTLDIGLTSTTILDQVFQYNWLLGDHNLSPVPGDKIEVFIEVWDNDSFTGFKSSRSELILLQFPSLSDQYDALGESQENAEDELDELLNEATDVRKRFDELREELRANPDSDWQNSREMEQLMEAQERIEERVDEFTNEVDDLIQQMEDNGLVSEETLDMYEELKKVSEEINSPELMDALEDLQDAMEQMSLDAMQEAVEKFEFSEDQYRERLERTLDLFKKFKTQQSIDEVEKRAEDLAQTEENLREKTEQVEKNMDEAAKNGEPTQEQKEQTQEDLDKLAAEQERAKKEMESLMERLEEIKEEMKDVKSAPKDEMQQMTDQLEQQDLPQKMQENADQLKKQETQPAQQGQQQMQQQLSQMQQNLSQMQQNMSGSQNNIDMQGLRQALNDILILSRNQEILRIEVEDIAGDSHVLRGFAQQQLELSEGLSTVSDSLQQMAREIPQMSREVQVQTGEALREMGSAIGAMSDRVARRATGHQKSAMMHMNELAVLLSDLLSQMMNQQSGMGGGQSMEQMVEQLQDMAGQQQQLNQQLQEMLNDAQGQRLTGDAQERLNQLAQQQEALRKQLKQMSRNPDLRGKLLGDLNKIAEQMLESVEDFQRRRASDHMVERQKEIVTRMLEATKSMQERGREKKRESESGRAQNRLGPDQLEDAETADQLRRDLIRAMEAGYSPDYEALIKKYFKLLEEGGQ